MNMVGHSLRPNCVMSEHLSLAWWAADVATRMEPVIYRKSRRQRWVFLFRQRFASFFLSEKWRRPFVIYCFTFLRCSVTKNSGRSKGVRFLCFGFCGRADATAPRPVLHCHVLLFAVVVPVFFLSRPASGTVRTERGANLFTPVSQLMNAAIH